MSEVRRIRPTPDIRTLISTMIGCRRSEIGCRKDVPSDHRSPTSDLCSFYQLAFVIPGSSPRLASSRKQMRQQSKSRMYPRFRPHRQHRRMTRVVYFGFTRDRAALMTEDFLAIPLYE